MQPSSMFCRAQEALQLSRASASTLDNTRNVANLAAAAWAKEALAADRREERLSRSRQASAELHLEMPAEAQTADENADLAYSDGPEDDD